MEYQGIPSLQGLDRAIGSSSSLPVRDVAPSSLPACAHHPAVIVVSEIGDKTFLMYDKSPTA